MKAKNLREEDKEELEIYINNNKPKNMGSVIEQFKKEYSTSNFNCKSSNQKEIIKSIGNDNIVTVVSGLPGTGKTFSAIQGVLKEFKKGNYKKIYLLKSVKTLDNKSEDLGFLKGSIEEKIAPFMFSYDFNFAQIIPKATYLKARQSELIEFLPLAYIRGIGLTDCLIILDESQNVNSSILRTVLSRIGNNSKIVILGDTKQKDSDSKHTSGLEFLIKHFTNIEGINFIEMTTKDQSRSLMINNIEGRYNELEEQGVKID